MLEEVGGCDRADYEFGCGSLSGIITSTIKLFGVVALSSRYIAAVVMIIGTSIVGLYLHQIE